MTESNETSFIEDEEDAVAQVQNRQLKGSDKKSDYEINKLEINGPANWK